MKKHIILSVVAIAVVSLLTGCGNILIRPAVDKVKSVAMVSVYMNRDFYDIKAPAAGESKEALKTLGRAVMKQTGVLDKLDNTFNAEYQQIVSYAVKKFSEQLDGLGTFSLVPVENVLQNPAYQDFVARTAKDQPSGALVAFGAAIASADWYTAPNMIHIPADALVEASGQHTTYLGKTTDPRKEFRTAMAKLCVDLGVDAVAVIQLDMAYKKPKISINLGTGSPAKPLVASTLIVVNKDGDVAVNTGLFGKGAGQYSESANVPMLRKGNVFLNDKSVSSYCQAIDKSCLALKNRMTKAFTKIK